MQITGTIWTISLNGDKILDIKTKAPLAALLVVKAAPITQSHFCNQKMVLDEFHQPLKEKFSHDCQEN